MTLRYLPTCRQFAPRQTGAKLTSGSGSESNVKDVLKLYNGLSLSLPSLLSVPLVLVLLELGLAGVDICRTRARDSAA